MHPILRKMHRSLVARPVPGVVALAVCLCLAGVAVGPAPSSPYLREDVRIRPSEARYTLAVTIVRPHGAGPFGAIVLNHGAGPTPAARLAESPALFLHIAAAFVQRGYAVIMPLRRGFGATGGKFAEDTGPCTDPNFREGERNAAADVLAAYEYARKLPYVDPSRMILAGQSAGAVASLYAAALNPEGLVAVLAFAAGRGADPLHPGVPCGAERLATVFEELGRVVPAPVLLHYAENDLSFGPATSQLWFKHFKSGGGRGEFLLQPPFGKDGHYVFTDNAGLRIWLPAVEQFLQRHGIPFDAPKQRA